MAQPTTLGDIRRNRDLTREDVAKQLGCSFQFLAQIETHRRSLAPNHPLLPKLAEILGLTLPEIQAFAGHEPLTESQLKLTKFRLGRKSHNKAIHPTPNAARVLLNGDGTATPIEEPDYTIEIDEGHRINKSGTAVAVQPRSRAVAHTNGDRVKSLQSHREQTLKLQRVQMAKQLGVSTAFVLNVIENPKGLAKNHPVIPKVAEFYKLSEDEVRRHAHKAKMDNRALVKSVERLGKPHPGRGNGKALVRVTGAHHLTAARAPQRSQMGRLPASVRQTARAIATQLTLHNAKGDTFARLQVPVKDLTAIFNDWCHLRGTPVPVVLEVNYDEVFG